MMKRLLFTLLCSFAIFTGTVFILGAKSPSPQAILAKPLTPNATTYYVSSVSGDDDNDCTPNAPCQTIQHAVNLATDGDEILIAALDNGASATYTNTGTTPIVTINKRIALRGGYTYIHIIGPGTWQRSPLLPMFSTLDGEAQRQGIYISGDITVTLEWLSLTNGNAPQGGNLYAEDSTVQLSAILVLSGTATHGGGIYLKNCRTNFNPVEFDFGDLTNLSGALLVQNNSADYGGGLYIDGGEPSLSAVIVYTNTATEGGGLYIKQGQPIIAGGLVLENQAEQHGGGLYLEQSVARIAGTAVYSNSAKQGAGFYLDGPLVSWPIDVPIIANTYVRYNQGGGFYFHEAVAGLVNNVIADNAGTNGAAATLWASSPQFYHNTIANNTGDSAIYLAHRPSQVFPVHPLLPSLPRLVNNIIASHTLGIYAESTGLIYPLENRATLEGTLWWGNGTQTDGPGQVNETQSIAGDPLFTCTGPIAECINPYHIQETSPAVDAGIELLMDLPDDEAFLTDIDGQLRPSGAGYDIGADEVVTLSFNVWLIPPLNTATSTPGDTLTYTHQLLNTGTQTDTYDLKLDSSTGWAALLTPTPLMLSAQASTTVRIRVTVPDTATSGMVDTTTLTATSRADPALSATAIDRTFVVSDSISPSDIAVDKWADVSNVNPGDVIHYTIRITKSEGITPSVNITLSDTLVPTQVVAAWALPTPCTGDMDAGTITCHWTLPASSLQLARTVPIIVTTSNSISSTLIGGNLVNIAIVSASVPEINLLNNVDQVTVYLGGPERIYLPLVMRDFIPTQ